MNFSKYGFLPSDNEFKVDKNLLQTILDKYNCDKKIMSETEISSLFFSLVGGFAIPNGKFNKKSFYPGIDASEAVFMRRYLLSVNLRDQHSIENYKTLLPSWSLTFEELVLTSKKL